MSLYILPLLNAIKTHLFKREKICYFMILLHASFWIIILIFAAKTITTDIASHKIQNNDLYIILISAIFFLLGSKISLRNIAAWGTNIGLNFLIFLSIGFLLFFINIWAPGDAKLFAVLGIVLQLGLSNYSTNTALLILKIAFILGSLYILYKIVKKGIYHLYRTTIQKIVLDIPESLIIIFGFIWGIQTVVSYLGLDLQEYTIFIFILVSSIFSKIKLFSIKSTSSSEEFYHLLD
jgi:Flp pilus assembly protein protease CpaA